MSLSSALFSGISGMNTLGNSMTVIGDNIANVSTVGFKSSRVTFQDVLAQTVSTQSGTGQLGRGAAMGDITGIFSQGSLETTDSATDLAIGGEGFFVVRDPENVNLEYYTRAGEFRFDEDGNFVNPSGYLVRGWSLDQNGNEEGSIGDIILNSFTSPPEATDKVTLITNLDSDGEDNSLDADVKTASLGTVTLGGDAVNHPIYLTLNNQTAVNTDVSQFAVAWNSGAGTWSITHGATEYPAAVIAGDAAGFTIDLDNDGTTDITGRTGGSLTADGTGSFDIEAPGALGVVTQGGDAVNNNIMVTVSDSEAILAMASGFEVSWTNATATWSITNGLANYPSASVSGNANSFEVDLDGNGTTDISGTVAGGGMTADATGSFDIYPPNGMLAQTWDGTATPPLGDGAYEYQAILKVYDSLGNTHDLTVYYDKGDNEGEYEFIVTVAPDEDARGGGTTGLPDIDTTIDTGAGLLARGVLNFTSDGEINDLQMWEFNSDGTDWSTDNADNWTALNPDNASHISSDGYFYLNPSFAEDLTSPMEFNLGMAYDGTAWVQESLSTTQYASAGNTTYQATTGYGVGDLDGISVSSDGVITGSYSNGQIKPLFRIALAKFNNVQGLQKMGQNMFAATRNSGDAITNKPGTNGLGTITSNALEQSNVDLANEFVKMITTQRGYQANSKVITVTDQLLQEVINLKR
ncbi:flagellar hook protein FlgE [Desulfatibacillum alkenivorans DSM 16219]|jgi:flagellar hook protein FlgE|uniref:Flagellar hook protein FlgE n=1 Tax=Desulfatibacillum alkenivorans DSM 16219 TaxID=1121393 RepID=A0A1M6HHI2_9BACT|nr:flagellar hook-basal body complex protein [Desulfatibacillum alkenivorans]SHJ21706.1 flagellar hook protein FlgE [Desulfatibacillum alkenivorans DSM 16219]